ncbi:endogenous retrovirus group K member 6 Gag polyprotein-like isoform 1-T1 [Acridotheres tristis]
MGQNISKEQREIYDKLKTLIRLHSRSVPKQEIKDLLLWVVKNFSEATIDSAFRKSLWDAVGIRLFDLATKRDKVAASLLPTCHVIIEILNDCTAHSLISGISTAPQQEPALTELTPALAACNIAPGERGEACLEKGAEASLEEMGQTIEVGDFDPETFNSRAEMQDQNEYSTSEDDFNLSHPAISQLPSAEIRNPFSPYEVKDPVKRDLQCSLTDWNVMHGKVIKEGDPGWAHELLLTTPARYGRRGANPRWEAVSHEDIKYLQKAIRRSGLGSPYFKQLLKEIYNTLDMTPFDCRNVSSTILTNSQYILWDLKWRRLLNKLIENYAGGPNAALTLAHLAGDAPHDRVEDQADLPRGVLGDIKDAAKKALLQIETAESPHGLYTQIKQGPTEPYASFIDRLTQAIERQCDDDTARPILLHNLAFANANEECQRVIRTLPDLQPNLSQMIEVCSKTRSPLHITTIQADTLGERIERAITTQAEIMDKRFAAQTEMLVNSFTKALNALVNNPRTISQANDKTCFGCGKPGHVTRNCPVPIKKVNRCPRCKKGSHYANQCYSKYDIYGNLLPGNGFPSAQHHCTTKQVVAAAQQPELKSSGDQSQAQSAGLSNTSRVTPASCVPGHSAPKQLPN